jgi:hypothetical protein
VYLEIPYERENITDSKAYFKSKPTLAHKGLKFPNLPYLTDGDIKKSDVYAIMTYLANKVNRHDILPNVANLGLMLKLKDVIDGFEQ